jgi:hypothetical protein
VEYLQTDFLLTLRSYLPLLLPLHFTQITQLKYGGDRSTRSTAKASGANSEAMSSKITTKRDSKGTANANAEDDDLIFQPGVPELDDLIQSASEFGEPVTGQRRRERT